MSTNTLTGLRDYLYATLTPANMMWLSTQLADYAKQMEEPALKSYTLEEMKAQLLQAKRDFDAGLGIPDEEVWDELEELEREELSLKPFESEIVISKRKRRQQAIVGMISNDSHVSVETMEILCVDKKTIKRDLKELKDNHVIERVGGTFGGEWKVLKKNKDCNKNKLEDTNERQYNYEETISFTRDDVAVDDGKCRS